MHRKNFFMVPNSIFDLELKPRDFTVYCCLLRHSDSENSSCFPSRRIIANEKLSKAIAAMSKEQSLRISKSMFRYAVELELIMRMLSEVLNFDPDELEEMRGEAIQNVRRTRGTVRLDDLFKRKDTQSL